MLATYEVMVKGLLQPAPVLGVPFKEQGLHHECGCTRKRLRDYVGTNGKRGACPPQAVPLPCLLLLSHATLHLDKEQGNEVEQTLHLDQAPGPTEHWVS